MSRPSVNIPKDADAAVSEFVASSSGFALALSRVGEAPENEVVDALRQRAKGLSLKAMAERVDAIMDALSAFRGSVSEAMAQGPMGSKKEATNYKDSIDQFLAKETLFTLQSELLMGISAESGGRRGHKKPRHAQIILAILLELQKGGEEQVLAIDFWPQFLKKFGLSESNHALRVSFMNAVNGPLADTLEKLLDHKGSVVSFGVNPDLLEFPDGQTPVQVISAICRNATSIDEVGFKLGRYLGCNLAELKILVKMLQAEGGNVKGVSLREANEDVVNGLIKKMPEGTCYREGSRVVFIASFSRLISKFFQRDEV